MFVDDTNHFINQLRFDKKNKIAFQNNAAARLTVFVTEVYGLI